MIIKIQKQSGSVSLFVVIFAALLITVVILSFIKIMLQDQQQATSVDLSQSAYDTAQAGVEDSKRALVRFMSICNSGDIAGCQALQEKMNSSTCNEAVKTLSDVDQITAGEVKVKTGDDNNLDQAYTCVKIILNTDDYLGDINKDESIIVPIKATTSFDTIQVQWFGSKNAGTNGTIDLLPTGTDPLPLIWQNSWPSNRPPIIRAQVVQFSTDGFMLSDLDIDTSTSTGNDTVFLYPLGQTNWAIVDESSEYARNPKDLATLDPRRTNSALSRPTAVNCSGNLSSGGYSCKSQLKIPNLSGSGRTVFLRLTAYYNKADFRVSLVNSVGEANEQPQFNAVQPEIDSTGRANNVFRRLKTRVELEDVNFAYPAAAVDISGSFCKDFSVTDNTNDYNKIDKYSYIPKDQTGSIGTCTP